MRIPAQPAQLYMLAQAPVQIHVQAQAPAQIHAQAQAPAQINYPAVTRGLPNADHEINMIDNLRQHIRESLSGIPHDLPELKGVRAKLLEAYRGEDNFDHLNNWLQGLLRFFKLHCITGVDKDRDMVLVTGTSLKGKAE
jgi:hypothetical protein